MFLQSVLSKIKKNTMFHFYIKIAVYVNGMFHILTDIDHCCIAEVQLELLTWMSWTMLILSSNHLLSNELICPDIVIHHSKLNIILIHKVF